MSSIEEEYRIQYTYIIYILWFIQRIDVKKVGPKNKKNQMAQHELVD